MTIAEAWDVLDAADVIARAHGWECVPTIRRGFLHLQLERGSAIRHVVLADADLDACTDIAAKREMAQREVAGALADRSATA